MSVCEYHCKANYIREASVIYSQLYLQEDMRSTTDMRRIVHECCE